MQKVIILSGPSGVGKNTLGDFLLQQFPELSYSVSATTRAIRKGEQDGVDRDESLHEFPLTDVVVPGMVSDDRGVGPPLRVTIRHSVRRATADGVG